MTPAQDVDEAVEHGSTEQPEEVVEELVIEEVSIDGMCGVY